MSKEELDGLTEEERIEKAKQEAVDAAKEEAKAEAEAEAKKAETAMVAELQAERQRRQAAEEELERSKGTPSPEGDDPEQVFQRLMDEDKAKKAKEAHSEALEEFKRATRELSEENDPAGLVFSAFEKELRKFNFEGLTSKEDFLGRFKEVHEHMNRHKKPAEANTPDYPGGEGTPGSTPKEDDEANLSDVEARLIKDMGWTKERYLEQKTKRPHYVASLLKYRA